MVPAGCTTIRIATEEDADAVSALLSASYPALLADYYDRAVLDLALPLITKANPMLLASGTFYFAESQGYSVTACGGWTMEQPGTGTLESGIAHIRHFGTHPNWVRQGLARAILERCVEDASARDVRVLECQSTLAAEEFYAAQGFKTLGTIEVILTPNVPFPALLMRRALG
jgi:GNAT superfamily N-acetyltransferase